MIWGQKATKHRGFNIFSDLWEIKSSGTKRRRPTDAGTGAPSPCTRALWPDQSLSRTSAINMRIWMTRPRTNNIHQLSEDPSDLLKLWVYFRCGWPRLGAGKMHADDRASGKIQQISSVHTALCGWSPVLSGIQLETLATWIAEAIFYKPAPCLIPQPTLT